MEQVRAFLDWLPANIDYVLWLAAMAFYGVFALLLIGLVVCPRRRRAFGVFGGVYSGKTVFWTMFVKRLEKGQIPPCCGHLAEKDWALDIPQPAMDQVNDHYRMLIDDAEKDPSKRWPVQNIIYKLDAIEFSIVNAAPGSQSETYGAKSYDIPGEAFEHLKDIGASGYRKWKRSLGEQRKAGILTSQQYEDKIRVVRTVIAHLRSREGCLFLLDGPSLKQQAAQDNENNLYCGVLEVLGRRKLHKSVIVALGKADEIRTDLYAPPIELTRAQRFRRLIRSLLYCDGSAGDKAEDYADTHLHRAYMWMKIRIPDIGFVGLSSVGETVPAPPEYAEAGKPLPNIQDDGGPTEEFHVVRPFFLLLDMIFKRRLRHALKWFVAATCLLAVSWAVLRVKPALRNLAGRDESADVRTVAAARPTATTRGEPSADGTGAAGQARGGGD